MKEKSPSQPELGCSLVETLIAMSILAIIMTGSLAMFAVAQSGIADGGASLEVAALVESRLERFRALPYQSLLSADLDDDGKTDFVLEDVESARFTLRQIIDRVAITYTIIPDGPDLLRSSAVTITLIADWADMHGRQRTIRLGVRRANPVYGGLSS